MSATSSDSALAPVVVAAVVDLAERLRAAGIPVSTGEVLDATGALAVVDVARRELVRVSLRATLVKDGARLREFDRAFNEVFPAAREDVRSGQPPEAPRLDADGRDDVDRVVDELRDGNIEAVREFFDSTVDEHSGVHEGRSVEHHTQRVLRRMDLAEIHRRYLAGAGERSELERLMTGIEAQRAMQEIRELIERMVAERMTVPPPAVDPSRGGDLADVDLLRARPDQLAALRLALRPLARQLASRLGQRKRRGRGTLDMRRTLRSSMGAGGVPLSPALRRRRPTRPELVVLCDVSGSTAEFAPFTLALLHAVHQEFSRVRSFVFVDGVVEITGILESSPGVLDPRHLLDRRGLVVGDGRSDYRRALRAFLEVWPTAVTPRTTVLVVGDARSHDREPALAEVARLQHDARRLYWFNPEPAEEWDTGDSRVSEYAALCTAVFEVSTLRQLVDSVATIA